MTKLSSLGLLIAVQKLLELTRFEKLLLLKYSVTFDDKEFEIPDEYLI